MTRFDHTFKTYFVQLCTFAYPFVRSQDIAKDIVHDAYLVLINNPELLEKESLIQKSFLYSTVKNLAMNYQRKVRLSSKYSSSLNIEPIDDTDLMDNLIRAEVISALHKELNALPTGCRHVCRLIYMEGKKYEEVASELKISVNTVKSQRSLAIRLLREKFSSIFILISILLYIKLL
ncbi:sigma-70 family RNA polymerase sigma factor [Sphingobacterium athyrii]|uniref:RNA polymerase sigma factor 70 region 4 type 2 domain-containing protein n=1 Tax=Sphingobacterium athyrii TaxID=2152717 RepID=A0A363NUM8_9SPHI|nr:sigma-70 family RNA polymerase sigma factor [Sphingobacterium athyrii]PUV24525.1 hypothetical protein DCO56_14380 [Sphingobacterium athyrii]